MPTVDRPQNERCRRGCLKTECHSPSQISSCSPLSLAGSKAPRGCAGARLAARQAPPLSVSAQSAQASLAARQSHSGPDHHRRTHAATSRHQSPQVHVQPSGTGSHASRQVFIADNTRSAASPGSSTAEGTAPSHRPSSVAPATDPAAMTARRHGCPAAPGSCGPGCSVRIRQHHRQADRERQAAGELDVHAEQQHQGRDQ